MDIVATNPTSMKLKNRSLILNLIRKEPISRAEIARKVSLTRAAVSIIIEDLIKEGVVVEMGLGKSLMGRKPVCLGINSNYKYCVGVDITKSRCLIGIVSLTGEIIAKKRIDFTSLKHADHGVDLIAQAILDLLDNTIEEIEKIISIGISTPGPVDIFKGKILNPPNLILWNNYNIVEKLEQKLNIPVCLDNVSFANTLAEKMFGIGISYNSFVELKIDEDGIGAGIIIDEKLYRGAGGLGSEVGHTSIDINGRECACGNTGCIERYAATSVIVKEAQETYPNIHSWEEIVDRASFDDAFLDIIKKEARYLAASIINIVNIFELEVVVLTGDVTYKPDMLIDEICKIVHQKSINRDIRKSKIVASKLNGDIHEIAAATIVIDMFYTGRISKLIENNN